MPSPEVAMSPEVSVLCYTNFGKDILGKCRLHDTADSPPKLERERAGCGQSYTATSQSRPLQAYFLCYHLAVQIGITVEHLTIFGPPKIEL